MKQISTSSSANALSSKERLRNAKVRVTQARVDVLEILLNKQRALTHHELQDALPAMDRVTLYRALDCLSESGLAHKITGEDRVYRFSTGNEAHSSSTSNHSTAHQHGHFTCMQCAQVFCLENPLPHFSLKDQLQATLEATKKNGFQSHHIEVTIKGWCPQCVKPS